MLLIVEDEYRPLLAAIGKNLLRLKMHPSCGIFDMQQVLRDNWAHLNRGVDVLEDPSFINCLSIREARDVEDVLDKSFFVEHFADKRNNLSYVDCMRRTRSYISRRFFTLAGVCKDVVAQGLLNYECWEISSFLKFNDVTAS